MEEDKFDNEYKWEQEYKSTWKILKEANIDSNVFHKQQAN
jgi:hypothetical protein